jgi:tRNA pseudouridine38-40 synthase
VRTVRRAGWSDQGEGVLRFEIEANAFCHQMIRSIVGTLVDVGLARKHAGDLLGIIAGRDRSKGSQLAPPQGLCLWAVSYPTR